MTDLATIYLSSRQLSMKVYSLEQLSMIFGCVLPLGDMMVCGTNTTNIICHINSIVQNVSRIAVHGITPLE